MPKILYVWKGKYPWDIRVEKFCKSFIKNGFEVFLVARWAENQPVRENYKGINIIRAGYQKNYKLTQPVSFNPIWSNCIKKVVNEVNPDLIMPRDIMLAETCGRIGRKYDIPVVMDMAEHYPAAMKGWKKYSDNIFLRILVHSFNVPEKVEKRAIKLMDGIITVCQEQIERLNVDYNYKMDKMNVVHNTPEVRQFSGVKLKDSPSVKIFGHHGYTTDEKSIRNFLLGFILAAEEDMNIEFHIAGSGESLDELMNIAKNSNVSNKIKFTGEYKFEDLNQIISQFDVGVIPYQINDFNNYTIHNKIFDYFSAGKPVLVSETKPFKRIISETSAGISDNCENIESIKNAILDFKNHDIIKMAENGRKAFESKYNWDVDSANLLSFIKKYI
jgi:glycosyltransferase involved in cell wall biosynthesis